MHTYVRIYTCIPLSPLPPQFFSLKDSFHEISLEIPLIFVMVNHQVPPTDLFEKKGYDNVNIAGRKRVTMLRVAGFRELTGVN